MSRVIPATPLLGVRLKMGGSPARRGQQWTGAVKRGCGWMAKPQEWSVVGPWSKGPGSREAVLGLVLWKRNSELKSCPKRSDAQAQRWVEDALVMFNFVSSFEFY